MNTKKVLTVLSCSLMLGTSFTAVLSLDNSSTTVAKAAVNKKISAKQYYSDIRAAEIATVKGNLGTDLQYFKSQGLSAYTFSDDSMPDYGFAGLLTYSRNCGSGGYDAVKYLYHHFYNRFDNLTKQALRTSYDQSDVNDYGGLIGRLSSAIEAWGSHYSGIAPTVRSVNAAKKNLSHARYEYNKAKHQYAKKHSDNNKNNLNKAKNNLHRASIRYQALKN